MCVMYVRYVTYVGSVCICLVCSVSVCGVHSWEVYVVYALCTQCMHARVYARMYVCMHVCVCMCTVRVCMYTCNVCMSVCTYVYTAYMYVCMYVCMCMRMQVCGFCVFRRRTPTTSSSLAAFCGQTKCLVPRRKEVGGQTIGRGDEVVRCPEVASRSRAFKKKDDAVREPEPFVWDKSLAAVRTQCPAASCRCNREMVDAAVTLAPRSRLTM